MGKVKNMPHSNCNTQFLHISKVEKQEELFQNMPMYRHVDVHSILNNFLSHRQLKGPRVGSFVSFCKDWTTQLNVKYTSTIPNAFNLLRVLESKQTHGTLLSPVFPIPSRNYGTYKHLWLKQIYKRLKSKQIYVR